MIDLEKEPKCSFGNIVKKLMEMQGLKIADLSRQIGMPQTTIARIITGNTDNPMASTLLLLAEYFNVSVDDLLGRKFSNELSDNTSPSKHFSECSPDYIPLINWNSVKNWFFNKTKFLSEEKYETIAISTKISSNSCGIITDKTFGKVFTKGSILIMDSEAAYRDDDFVIVSINKGYPTIKQVCEDSDKRYLNPVGLIIPSVELESESPHVIFGKITECRILF